jgi:hypothetical protein
MFLKHRPVQLILFVWLFWEGMLCLSLMRPCTYDGHLSTIISRNQLLPWPLHAQPRSPHLPALPGSTATLSQLLPTPVLLGQQSLAAP